MKWLGRKITQVRLQLDGGHRFGSLPHHPKFSYIRVLLFMMRPHKTITRWRIPRFPLIIFLILIFSALAQSGYAQKKGDDLDDLDKSIEAEIKAEMEAAKAAEKAAKAKAKEEADAKKNAAAAAAKKAKEEAAAAKAAEAAAAAKAKKEAEARKAAEAKQKQYDDLIAKGDGLLASKSYDKAVEAYNGALKVKPNDSGAQAKITLAKKKKAEEEAAVKAAAAAARDKKFQDAISRGDDMLAAKDYDKAVTAYQEALKVKPGDAGAQAKLDSVAKAREAAKQAELDDKFAGFIKQGDDHLASKSFDKAETAYKEAVKLKPNDPQGKSKLDALKKAREAALAKEKDDQFNQALAKGDDQLAKNEFAEARKSFQEALGIKPGDATAEARIKKVDDAEKAAANAAQKEKFDGFISQGDDFLKQKDFDKARGAYNEALKVIPGDAGAQKKLSDVDAAEKAAEQQEKETKFNDFIKQGDDLLAGKDFAKARSAYNEAGKVLPGDSRVDAKLKAVDAAESAAKNAELESEFTGLIQKGDDLLAKKDFAKARDAYNEALGVIAGDARALDKIKAVDAAEAAENQAQLEGKYTDMLKQGDDLLASKDFDKAEDAYRSAKELLPEDPRADQKLKEVANQRQAAADAEKAKAEAEKQAQIEEKYNAAISAGDQFLSGKNYAKARDSYNEALSVKPGDSGATNKLAEVDRQEAAAKKAEQDAAAAAAQAQEDEKFNGFLSQGDDWLADGKFDKARASYQQALDMRPGDATASSKMKAVDQKEAELKDAALAKEQAAKKAAEDEKFNGFISQGDDWLADNKYDKAKASYQQALDMRPGDATASARMKSVDKKQEEALNAQKSAEEAKAKAELNEQISALITKGDAELSSGNFDKAREIYGEAKSLDPSNPAPDKKIAEANRKEKAAQDAEKNKQLAAEQAALDKEFNGYLEKGDRYMASEEFSKALEEYGKASELKPNDATLASKMKAVTSARDAALAKKAEQEQAAAREETEREYQTLVQQGDKFLNKKDYSKATSAYNEAKKLMPGKSEIAAKLKAVEDAKNAEVAAAEAKQNAKRQEELKKQADEIVLVANDLYNRRKRDDAKAKYQEALDLYPSHVEARAKMDEILKKEEEKALAQKRRAEEAKRKKDEEIAQKRAEEAARKKLAEEREAQRQRIAEAKAKAAANRASNPPSTNRFKTETLDDSGPVRKDKLKFRLDLARKYGDGITEEVIEEEGKTTLRRVVVKEGVGDEFLRVKHSWGGTFYFKNGLAISYYTWKVQTEP